MDTHFIKRTIRGLLLWGSVAACPFIAIGQLPELTLAEEHGQRRTAGATNELLQWQFHVGDNYQVYQQTVTTITDEQHNRYRNEVHRDYDWQITHVDLDGTATLAVIPRRIRLNFQYPPGQFDSQRDNPAGGVVADPNWRAELFEARNWVHSRFHCRVNVLGQVSDVWGALPESAAYPPTVYTPVAFGILPGDPARMGQTWDQEGGTVPDGQAPYASTYRITDRVIVDGNPVYRIEAMTTWIGQHKELALAGDFGPTVSVSHFDPLAGHFLGQIRVTSGVVELGPKQLVAAKVGTLRKVSRLAEAVHESVEPAAFMFPVRSGEVPAMQFVRVDPGSPLASPATIGSGIWLMFHHGWVDVNQDVMPDAVELADISTEFSVGEPVQALLMASGMKECRVRVDVISGQGELVSREEVPVSEGRVRLAHLRREGLAPGVYFFEWSVNDQQLIRIPVRVYSAAGTSPANALGNN